MASHQQTELQRKRLVQVAVACTAMAAAWWYLQRTNCRRRKRFGKLQLYRDRSSKGVYHQLVPNLRQDPEMHFVYFRMSAERFQKLLCLVAPKLEKRSWSTPLTPGERLCITLRYLATGMSMTALTFEYKVCKSTISNVIREVCRVLWQELQTLYMPTPNHSLWRELAQEMYEKWDIPNCVGAIDGKHVQIRTPENKESNCMVLMATCNANRCFSTIDVSWQSRISDGGVFNASTLGKKLRQGTLELPNPEEIPATSCRSEFFFVGDDVFPLLNNVMRPYPGSTLLLDKQIYNYRISRAGILIENAFGILTARWHIYHTPIHANPEAVEDIVKATCILHNFIMVEDRMLPLTARQYCPPGFVDHERDGTLIEGEWRRIISSGGALQSMRRLSSNNYARSANETRVALTKYFTSDLGALPLQNSYVLRGGR